MEVKFYETHEIADSLLSYAVIVSRYMDKWVLCKNRSRKSWEIPGGRREAQEAISDTARRELFEETGATKFDLIDLMPIGVYSVKGESESFGMIYFAEIRAFDPLPESEIEAVGFFQDNDLPELSFPLIQPKLIQRVKSVLHL